MIRIIASIVMITLVLAPFGFLIISQNARAGSYVLFSEGFEGSWPGVWVPFDGEPLDGDDYWGVTTYKARSGSNSAWCAQVGTNSDDGNPNSVNHYYDNNMQSEMRISIGDISGYTSVTLDFYYWSNVEGIIFWYDYLTVWTWDGAWTKQWDQSTSGAHNTGGWDLVSIPIPLSVTIIEFYFLADSSNYNYEGVYIDDISITGDESSPPISSVSPLSPYYNSLTIDVPYTANDNVGGSGIDYVELYYTTDGGTNWVQYGANFYSSPISFTAPADGTYGFYTVATDNATNVEAGGAPVGGTLPDASTMIDTLEPTSSAGVLPTYEIITTFNIIYTADDGSGSGIENVSLWYKKDSGSWTLYGNFTSSPISFDTTTTGGDGSYQFYTIAWDVANNVEAAPLNPDATTYVDTTLPTSSVSGLPAYQNMLAFNVPYTADDGTGSGIQYVELYYTPNGGTTWNKYGTTYTSSPILFDVTLLGGAGTYGFFTVTTDTATNIEAGGVPSSGTSPDSSTIVDLTNPTSSSDILSTYTNAETFTVTASASDTNGIMKVELWYMKDSGSWTKYGNDTASPWSWEFDTSTTGGDGIYQFYTRAHDMANNYEDAPVTNDTWTLVDTITPTSNTDILSTYTTTEVITINATASDTNEILDIELWYMKDSGSWTKYGNDTASPWSWEFDTSTTGGDGIYRFYTKAHDMANNYEDTPSTNDTWTLVDTTEPISSLNTIPTYTTTGTLTITATASDKNGVLDIELWYKRDDGPWTKYASGITFPWSFNFDSTAPGGDGIYQFYTRAHDIPNNYESAPAHNETWTIIDTTKPTINIQEPDSDSTVTSSDVDIKWSGSDATSNIDHFEVKIDNGEYINVGLDTNYTFEGVSDGSHTITIKAVDNAGNSEEATLNIDVDTNPLSPTGPYSGLPLYLLIIIVVVCILLAIWLMKRKKKPVDTEPQEELQEATPPSSPESSQELPPTSPGQGPSQEGPPLPRP